MLAKALPQGTLISHLGDARFDSWCRASWPKVSVIFLGISSVGPTHSNSFPSYTIKINLIRMNTLRCCRMLNYQPTICLFVLCYLYVNKILLTECLPKPGVVYTITRV